MHREIRVYRGEVFAGVFGDDDGAPAMPSQRRQPAFVAQMFEADDETARREGEAHARRVALHEHRWTWPRDVTVNLSTDGAVCITVPFAHDRPRPV